MKPIRVAVLAERLGTSAGGTEVYERCLLNAMHAGAQAAGDMEIIPVLAHKSAAEFLDRSLLPACRFLYPEGKLGTLLTAGPVIRMLRPEVVQPVCAACEAHGIEYILHGIREVYLPEAYQHLRDFYESFHIDTSSFQTEFDRRAVTTYKMEFLAPDEAAAAVYDGFMSDELTGMQDPFHRMNLELYARDETKGSGIIHALEHLSIPVENSFAFGDGVNDFEMMETVGTGLVMGNAGAALKEKADVLVPSVHEDGVAAGIRDYILPAAV